MSELKSIRVLEFDGKTSNWEGWSEKFKARAKRRGYKDMLVGKEKIPTASEYAAASTGSSADDKEIVKRAERNEEGCEDIILSISHTTKQGKVAFSLVKNCKTTEYPEGNVQMMWDRLEAKYAPKTAPSLLKLKKKFANSKLDSIEKHPDEWITELESLRNDMDSIDISTKMSDMDFMIHVLNNLPELYDVVLDGMESRLMLKDGDANKLMIEDIRDKLNNRYERIDEREKIELNTEKALAVFKGNCYKCGEYGHCGRECKNGDDKKGTDHGGGTRYKCHYCGKYGHKKYECELRKAHMKGEGKKDETSKLAVQYDSDDNESIDELGF